MAKVSCVADSRYADFGGLASRGFAQVEHASVAPEPSAIFHWMHAETLWLQAQRSVARGDLPAARRGFESLLALQPRHAGAHAMLASVLLAGGGVRASAAHLRAAADALPADPRFILRVAQASASVGETVAALRCLRHPALANATNAGHLLALGHQYQGLGLNPQALACMDRALAAGTDGADFRYFRALQLQFNGRIDEAEAEMEHCLRMGPTFGRASLSLARIRTQTAQSNHVDFIRRRLREVPPGSEDHAAFEFALYKELEDLGDSDAAWEALDRGNAIMRQRNARDADAERGLFDALIARIGDANRAAQTAHDGPTPIFIVGLPRSGTTLLERILGTHTEVASAGELADLPKQLRWTADQRGHALLDDALLAASDTLDYALLGQRYLIQAAWRAEDKPRFVDKLPANFMLVGHIRRALPQARVLHLVRGPMDVCFSNYRALFGDAYGYSYDFDSLARHHADYRRLMAHWHAAFPGFVLDVHYERLVADPEAVCREVLDFCGLPFEPACLDHTRNRASVSTLSSAQVREPVHARNLDAWRRYERQLRPFQELLVS